MILTKVDSKGFKFKKRNKLMNAVDAFITMHTAVAKCDRHEYKTPYSCSASLRRCIKEMELEDFVAVTVRDGELYFLNLKLLEEEGRNEYE